MSLAELLQYIQRQPLFLRHGRAGRVVAWSPNRPVPRPTRRAIREHTPMLRELLSRHDVNVCPSPGLHRAEWRYAGEGRYVCGACERLQAWIIPRKHESSYREQKAS
jgi:hypothetical protein